MYLIIYPNRANDSLRGKVSLLLANVSSKQVIISCKFEIGDQEAVLDNGHMDPKKGLGIVDSKFQNHEAHNQDQFLQDHEQGRYLQKSVSNAMRKR